MGQYEGVYDLPGEVYDGVYETVQGYMENRRVFMTYIQGVMTLQKGYMGR